jgi:hypothetical protein
MACNHISVTIPAPYLNPGELQGLRDDEIELVEVCLLCGLIIASLQAA